MTAPQIRHNQNFTTYEDSDTKTKEKSTETIDMRKKGKYDFKRPSRPLRRPSPPVALCRSPWSIPAWPLAPSTAP